MDKISITILGLNNAAGKELVDNLKKELLSFFYKKGFAETTINEKYNGVQYDMIKACLADDLVIFDASIEQNESGSWDSNYAAATASPCALDNILVVSRTRLPMNFPVLRTNVPELGREDKDASGNPITSFKNEEIVNWVISEIDQMTKPFELPNSTILPPRIPVSKDLKFNVPPFEQLATVADSLSEIQEKKMTESLDYIASVKREGAFISYRSYYHKNKYHGVNVEDLVKIIKEVHDDEEYPVTFYAEGDIAFEFMTEQRRWFVESFVDRKMRDMDEVWIFETDDRDGYGYYDSWWTQGEIISLMYMKANGSRLPKIYRCFYDEENKKMDYKLEDESFIPDLPGNLNHELAQYFANSDGANESMENMRKLRKMNFLYKRLAYWSMRKLQKQFMPSEMMSKLMEDNDYESFLSSVYAHVYDKSFTDNRIVYHPTNMRHYSIDDFKRPEFIKDFMLINSVRDDGKYKEEIESRGFFSVPPQDMKKVMETGMWKVPNSNDYKKIRKAEIPQFQWWPIRQGLPTGPNSVLIEKLDNWEFERNEK